MTIRESRSRAGRRAVAVACLQLACLGEDTIQARVRVTDGRAQALTSADLASVNGTYGPSCRNRSSGSWSLAAAPGAELDHDGLSVVRDNIACVLTLTEFHAGAPDAVEARPSITLTTSFGGVPSAFGLPLEFYANAALDDDSFADDFILTVLYSDDPRLGSATNTARPVPPEVVSTTPVADAVGRSIATRPRATFDVEMDPATLTDESFTVFLQGGDPVSGVVTVDALNRTATFTPEQALELDSVYEVTLSTDVEDARHTPLEEDFVWQFTTAAVSQGPVFLGTASGFAVLAGSTVTNEGNTSITGDLGVSPGAAVTGFPPGFLSGTEHVADGSADQAQTALTAAYVEAAARMLGSNVVAGDIGGQTLTPGLYASVSSLTVGMAGLTLDANGEEDAIFLIKMASTLTLGSGSNVVLTDGALAANVYWQVGTSATLGTGSTLRGTIMADQNITLNTGAALTGRALARSGAVTLDTNVVSRPPP